MLTLGCLQRRLLMEGLEGVRKLPAYIVQEVREDVEVLTVMLEDAVVEITVMEHRYHYRVLQWLRVKETSVDLYRKCA